MPHELRGYIGSIGAILWSLNGTIRVMGWFQYHMRGYKVSRLSGAIQWSLSGTRKSCGGLQYQMRGYKDFWSAIQFGL